MSSLIIEVCRVEECFKHPNADKLSVLKLKGWNCIVSLNQYNVGDLVVYVPPDSVIPSNLIEKYNLEYLRKDGRVKTVKLRNFISQGLVLDVPPGCKEGDDVSKILGITKYEVPEPVYTKGMKQTSKKKLHPLFDKYTDIENIKNFPNVFKDGDMVVITEKTHGSNGRFANLPIDINKKQPLWYQVIGLFKKYILKQKTEWIYGSHNVQISYHNNRSSYYGDDVWGYVAKKYNLKDILPEGYIFYGEVYGKKDGKGIQDLTYGMDDFDVRFFDIKDAKTGKYLGYQEFLDMTRRLGLNVVPVLYTGQWNNTLIIQCTDGRSIICPDQIREGFVVKSMNEENHPQIGRKILKSISTDYLTRKGDTTEYK